MKNKDKEPYIAIPIWFIKLTSNKKSPNYLTPFERELFWLINGLCKEGACYANDLYFSSIFNVTIKHINKSIHKLETIRLLHISHNNNKRFITASPIDRGSVFFCNNKDSIYITTETNVYRIPVKDWRYMADNNIDRSGEKELKKYALPRGA